LSNIKFLNETKEPKVSELGGKAYSLAVLINNGFNVPKGFIIISDAFFMFLKNNNLIGIIVKILGD
jgi:phosphoenolpyruvate synthase/pyruvate phosphate dikinase